MNPLDSPLEALAFNYLSFDFLTAVSNIWAWVAVIAATCSFIVTIRKPAAVAGSGTPLTEPDGRVQDRFPEPVQPSTPLNGSVNAAPDPPSAPSVRESETTEATTRGKFTVYYEDELAAVAGEEDDGGDGDSAEVGWELDGMVRMRILTGEELGWYRYQDLTVLDGNVVRLWDNCRKRRTMYSSGCFTAMW